jgi:hypothetical protein
MGDCPAKPLDEAIDHEGQKIVSAFSFLKKEAPH